MSMDHIEADVVLGGWGVKLATRRQLVPSLWRRANIYCRFPPTPPPSPRPRNALSDV